MSFWSKCKTSITDLTCFREACRKNNIAVTEVTDGQRMNGLPVRLILKDQDPNRRGYRQEAYLVEDGGAFSLIVDDDRGYSSISGRLGKNGGRLVRDYAEQVVEQQITMNGGMIENREETADGGIVLRIAAVG